MGDFTLFLDFGKNISRSRKIVFISKHLFGL